MSQRLLNKVAVITGASRGIGRAVAHRFLNEGAKVVAFARNRAALEEIAAQAPARVHVVDGDVTRSDDLSRLATSTSRRFGTADILVAAAGITRAEMLVDCSSDTVRELVEVNFLGPLATVRELLPNITDGGTMVFVTASEAMVGVPGLGLFQATKTALHAAAQSLAVELATRRIRVNCVAPGPIDSAVWEESAMLKKTRKRLATRVNHRPILGRFGKPEEVAETVLFLASEAAEHVNGQQLPVDGGYTIG